jgi:hypothetical protein
MQIHEITQLPPRPGFLNTVKSIKPGAMASGFVQGLTGVNFPRVKEPLEIKPTQAGTTERITVTLLQPGQSVPSKYYKVNNVWTNEIGTEIKEPRQTAYLDKMISTHGKKETLPAEPVAMPNRKVSRRRVKK